MTKRAPSNKVASVRQRLLNKIRETGEDASLVWSRYAIERFLYRLSVSEYGKDFVLKGAALFNVWAGHPYRPTLDVDLLGFGEDSGEHMADVFRSVCQVEAEPDGLFFDPETITTRPIREGQAYGGQRVMIRAFLGKALIPVRVDVAFGDVVTPRAVEVSYPTLLGFPAPCLRACTRETVVAEKLHAMVALGILNSRMKDFCDVHVLAQGYQFDGALLSRAIRATFERRATPLSVGLPLALTEEFGRDANKQIQWHAFLGRSEVGGVPEDFVGVVASLAAFLGPVVRALSQGEAFGLTWTPPGPWQ